jgi:hypothetical protein
VTAIINISSTRRMQIARIHCPEQCFSHTIKWPAIIRKIDATVAAAAIIPMVAIIIIIIVKRRSGPMALTLLTSTSCPRKGNTAVKLCESMSTTTRIQNKWKAIIFVCVCVRMSYSSLSSAFLWFFAFSVN